MTSCSYNQSYTYTGVDLIAKYCPNAKVYGVYGGSKAKSGIINLYRDLDRRRSNFTYLESQWGQILKKEAKNKLKKTSPERKKDLAVAKSFLH